MKKTYAFILLMIILLGVSGCGKAIYIVFPFAVSEIESIKVDYDSGKCEIEKTITEDADINCLYTYFSELPMQNTVTPPTGSVCTAKIVFNLVDGTNFELDYVGIAVKKGSLQSESEGFCYITSSDVIGVLESLSGEIE